jgi:hypothetical protein
MRSDPGVRLAFVPQLSSSPDDAGISRETPRAHSTARLRPTRSGGSSALPTAENKLAACSRSDADERTDLAVIVGAIAVGASWP